ncbi:MAG: replication-associated recombination protein A [Gammaproteobacteria bacterium]|nr:replication-associated recombination protein A [Gammaproteobacteria bacterium]
MSSNTDLFSNTDEHYRPLADRMRPRSMDEFVGQTHLLKQNSPLRAAIDSGRPHSMVLWGPPGTGKTTIAHLISIHCKVPFISLSAVLSGVKEIRAAIDQAKQYQAEQYPTTVLFVDEVHRFNKSQQDAFLPHIENGTVCFIGATTENPSFELNNALLSRMRTYVLKRLEVNDICDCIQDALTDSERGLAEQKIEIDAAHIETLAMAADGDARRALTLLEVASDLAKENDNSKVIDKEVIEQVTQSSLRRFDNKGEYFYDLISALHKSVRGTDPDAALYWYCRMLDGGCDPIYIARRVVRIASEDIGNADPRCLQLALNAWDTFTRLGSPEGELAIAQAIVFLACAPKSNAVYMAYNQAMRDAKDKGTLEVPMHLRNAPTKLMKDLDYGKDYRYAHNEEGGFASGENYFPDELYGTRYYSPVERGLEIKIKEMLQRLRTKC